MNEKELIGKIRQLRQIKPRKDWVILAKGQIFGEEKVRLSWIESLRLIFQSKPVLAGALAIFILFGVFSAAQSSLPGDLIYPVKKITEKARAVFVSETDKPKVDLELANKRLEEISKIASQNQVKKLAPAIEEYQKSVKKVATSLKKIAATTSDPAVVRKITEEAQKFEKKREEVESLGVVIGEETKEELDNAYKFYAEQEIKNLENSSLTEKQKEILKEAKEYFEEGDFLNALIKTVEVSQVR